jgi:drug/metabolite transporter superfamily protein YnfA
VEVPVTILFLAIAAVLEVSGDFLMRIGLGGRRWGFVAGALVLAGYGLLVNQPAWGFGRTLGLYIAIFFIVSQAVAFLPGGERPSPSLWLGGTLIVLGGLIIYTGKP